QIQHGIRARERPPGEPVPGENLEERLHVHFPIEEVVIVELDAIDAELPRQEAKVFLEPRRRRQRRLAAKHPRDAAEGAAVTAAERRLVACGAAAEVSLRQIPSRIAEQLVGE